MTVNRKRNRTKNLLWVIAIFTTLAYSGFMFYSYQHNLNKMEVKEDLATSELLVKEEQKAKIDAKIALLKKKQQSQKDAGIDVQNVKLNINTVLRAIEGQTVFIKSVKHHDNYNNLLDVKLVVTTNSVNSSAIANAFIVKSILNLKSIKNLFHVYKDYKIKGNEISFQYYLPIKTPTKL